MLFILDETNEPFLDILQKSIKWHERDIEEDHERLRNNSTLILFLYDEEITALHASCMHERFGVRV